MFEKLNTPNTEKAPTPAIPYKEFSKLEEGDKHELVTNTFQNLQNLLKQNGYEEFTNMSELYKNLPAKDYIVRRENPELIEQLLTHGEGYTIKHEGNTEYANSVEWNPNSMERNLENAYLEGYGNKNTVVLVIGVNQNANLQLKKLEESTADYYGLDRRGVRSVTGAVTPEHIAFISIRIPANMLPEELLTEDEIDAVYEAKESGSKKPIFAHRGYIRPTQ